MGTKTKGYENQCQRRAKVAISMSAQSVLGWEIVIVFLLMSGGALRVYMQTKDLFQKNLKINTRKITLRSYSKQPVFWRIAY